MEPYPKKQPQQASIKKCMLIGMQECVYVHKRGRERERESKLNIKRIPQDEGH